MNTPIEVKQKVIAGVLVFEFHGELDETNADRTFASIYDTIGEFTNKKVIFNLVGLKYLNSKSIGYIADIFSNIEEGNGIMCISNMTEEVKDTLELVGITSIVQVFESEIDALKTLGVDVPSA